MRKIITVFMLLFIACLPLNMACADNDSLPEIKGRYLSVDSVSDTWLKCEDVSEWRENICFDSFDVSEDGRIVIRTINNDILVINAAGSIERVYSINSYKKAYVKWKGDNILLYTVWWERFIEFTEECVIVSVFEIDGHDPETNRALLKLERVNHIEANGKVYSAEKHSINGYARLSVKDENGNSHVIYDAYDNYIERLIRLVLFLLIFASGMVLIPLFVIKKIKNR